MKLSEPSPRRCIRLIFCRCACSPPPPMCSPPLATDTSPTTCHRESMSFACSYVRLIPISSAGVYNMKPLECNHFFIYLTLHTPHIHMQKHNVQVEEPYLSPCSQLIPGKRPFHLFSIVKRKNTTELFLQRNASSFFFPLGFNAHPSSEERTGLWSQSPPVPVRPHESQGQRSLKLGLAGWRIPKKKSIKVSGPPALTRNFPSGSGATRQQDAAPERHSS